jgi:3-deoxy-7-phosphoheptulonate synthase
MEGVGTMSTWTPGSWKNKLALQQPLYPDEARLAEVVSELAALPPLVTSMEVESLKRQLAACADGSAFLLQGGDCAETFESCNADEITSKLKILLQMSLVLVHGTKRKVVRVGRIAGQYAKPRSSEKEIRGDVELPSYRGDLLNRMPFTSEDRTPDPDLLLRGYERAALTTNFIRALIDGGFADLHHPEYWDLGFVQHSPMRTEYERIVDSIRDSMDFIENVLDANLASSSRAEMYTSHEGLALNYEQAQTRTVRPNPGYYNLSTHFPWIGLRTADPDGAHVEYFRGIRNPIGVKLGPGSTPEHIVRLLDILHPDDEPGRMTLICRFGVDGVEEMLPPVIEAVRSTGKTVNWTVDPMHGNTEVTAEGVKTRRFETILAEVDATFRIHAEMGSHLGGIHFELTGEDVTECIGGARGLSETDLARAYRSTVDPRLNYEQSLEMAMIVAHRLREGSMTADV